MLHIVHFLKDIKKTGAVMPSSRYLAKDVVRLLENNLHIVDRKPVKILEIGAGTGIFTEKIIDHMKSDDHLDVVEMHDHFARLITQRLAGPNVHVHQCDFLDFETEKKYDYIFSSIPYEQLHSSISKQIWKRKLTLCRDESYITYYKYINFNRFRCKFEKDLVYKYGREEKVVLLNFPPAKLFTLKINADNEGFRRMLDVA